MVLELLPLLFALELVVTVLFVLEFDVSELLLSLSAAISFSFFGFLVLFGLLALFGLFLNSVVADILDEIF